MQYEHHAYISLCERTKPNFIYHILFRNTMFLQNIRNIESFLHVFKEVGINIEIPVRDTVDEEPAVHSSRNAKEVKWFIGIAGKGTDLIGFIFQNIDNLCVYMKFAKHLIPYVHQKVIQWMPPFLRRQFVYCRFLYHRSPGS